jgi:hypothetical protein
MNVYSKIKVNPLRNKRVQSLRRTQFWKYGRSIDNPCHIIMMWEFENAIRNEVL